jgi:ATP-dependent DNA ligase
MVFQKQLIKVGEKGKELIWEISVIDNVITTVSYQKGSKKKKIYTRDVRGKNIGKKNATSDNEQATKEALSKIENKIKLGYFFKDEQTPSDILIKCMLLKDITYKEDWLSKGCFQQPKLDGIRCLALYKDSEWILLSRNNKKFLYLNHIKADLDLLFDKNFIYDGELVHPDGFQTLCTLAGVHRKNKPPLELEQHVVLYIFDLINDKTQHERLNELSKFVAINTLPHHIRIIESIEVSGVNEIKRLHQIFVKNGYEGSVIRSMFSKYEGKRSSFCVKVKDFDSNEFEVVDFREGEGMDRGQVIWTCKTEKGTLFDCVPKATEIQRQHFLKTAKSYLGRLLTVRHQGYTDNDIPRFPIGISFRDIIE